MSRTRKDRNKQWRSIKNSLLKKTLHCYTEDIVHRRKDKNMSRVMRKQLKRLINTEMNGNDK